MVHMRWIGMPASFNGSMQSGCSTRAPDLAISSISSKPMCGMTRAVSSYAGSPVMSPGTSVQFS